MSTDDQAPASSGPKGGDVHVVGAGECISSIAQEHGHVWNTLWDHPANAALKSARGDPNVLLEGDQLTVPPLRVREESCAVDQRHRFVRKGVPAKFRLRVMEPPEQTPPPEQNAPAPVHQGKDLTTEDPPRSSQPDLDRPIANAAYVMTIDGQLFDGKTDANGYIDVAIPPDAKGGTITLYPGTLRERVMQLQLGYLAPVGELLGLKQRLANLSFDCGDRNNELSEGLRSAISAFQQKMQLTVTGEPDDALRQRVRDTHGS
ncbi:MAG: peptidoglycan-binding domain-containing protein [Rhodanobacter sp.]